MGQGDFRPDTLPTEPREDGVYEIKQLVVMLLYFVCHPLWERLATCGPGPHAAREAVFCGPRHDVRTPPSPTLATSYMNADMALVT